jgi:hypothetical protein
MRIVTPWCWPVTPTPRRMTATATGFDSPEGLKPSFSFSEDGGGGKRGRELSGHCTFLTNVARTISPPDPTSLRSGGSVAVGGGG